jgi:hypothetical protein
MGLASVPWAMSVPDTASSAREVSTPEAMRSLLVNETTTPGWMVRVTPGATVTSPSMV